MRKTQRRIRRRRGTKKYVRGGAPPLGTQSSRANIWNNNPRSISKSYLTVRNREQREYYNYIIAIKKMLLIEIEGIRQRINDYEIFSTTPDKIKDIVKRLNELDYQVRVLDENLTRTQINDIKVEIRKINIDVEELLKGVSLSAVLGRTPIFRDTPLKSNYQLTPLQKTSIMRNPPLSPFPQKTWSPPKHDFLSYTQPSP